MPLRIRLTLLGLIASSLVLLGYLGLRADTIGWSLPYVLAMVVVLFLIAWVAHCFLPSFDLTLQSRFHLPNDYKHKQKHKSKRIALTFDGGPDPLTTPKLLDLLLQEKLKATFFLQGSKVKLHPDIVQRVAQEGHEIGNHSYSHRKLLFSSKTLVEEEIVQTNKALEEVLQFKPRWFRSARGIKSLGTPFWVERLGMRMVGWSVQVWDKDRPGVEKILQRLLKRVEPRDIVLLHDGCGYGHNVQPDVTQLVAALKAAIPVWQDRGYEFVTLSEGFQTQKNGSN